MKKEAKDVKKARMTGGQLKRLRKEFEVSRADLGKRLGVTTQTVGVWERNYNSYLDENSTKKIVKFLIKRKSDTMEKIGQAVDRGLRENKKVSVKVLVHGKDVDRLVTDAVSAKSRDVHQDTANQIGCDREMGKAVNFGLMFSNGAKTQDDKKVDVVSSPADAIRRWELQASIQGPDAALDSTCKVLWQHLKPQQKQSVVKAMLDLVSPPSP